MSINELGSKLREMYEAKGENKVAMIHLFGIMYATEMINNGYKANEVIKAASMNESYQTELNKGIKLAKFVEVKSAYTNLFM